MTSTAIYTCYRQLHPPTGVDHAVFGSITAAGSHDLVVAKASILELYRVHRVGPDSDPAAATRNDATAATASSNGGNDDDDDDASSFFLELAGTFPIAGTITSLAVIPVVGGDILPPTTANTNASADACTNTSASDTDADATTIEAARRRRRQQQQEQDILVVSFGPAKMALVAYDSLLGRLGTLSIHNFDAEAIGPGAGGIEPGYGLASALKDRPATISTSDPSGRCLAAIVAGCQLVVLPTKKHVPHSVFVSEEARQRAQQLQRRRNRNLRRRGLLSPLSSEETAGDDAGFPMEAAVAGGGGGGGGGASDYGSMGRNGVVGWDGRNGEEGAKGAPGGGEGDGSIRSDGPRDGGPRLAVLKPFTINLEEAGFTG